MKYKHRDIRVSTMGYSSNVEEQGGGEPDYSFGIDRVIRVPSLDWGFQVLGRESMFPDEPPVDA